MILSNLFIYDLFIFTTNANKLKSLTSCHVKASTSTNNNCNQFQ